MAARTTTYRDDASRPPLYPWEEWLSIVRHFGLSPKQAQVVGWAIQSKRNKEIGRLLKISERTVREHIDESRRRMDAIDRMALSYRVTEAFLLIHPPRHRQK